MLNNDNIGLMQHNIIEHNGSST